MEAKVYLTMKEAAEYLGTTVNYLYKLTSQQHRIPYYSPTGRKTLFKRQELDEWIERSRIATADEIKQKAAAMSI